MPLVLQRSLQESIMIGENVEVTVIMIDGNRVKLMIEAPSDIPVHRKEVFLRLKQVPPEIVKDQSPSSARQKLLLKAELLKTV